MAKGSNLRVSSNLMIDDERHRPEYRYYPGDFVALIHPSYCGVRERDMFLSRKQIAEHEQYITCLICETTCAGTCRSPRR